MHKLTEKINICNYIDEMHVYKKTCLYFGILIAITCNMDRILVTLCCKKKFIKQKAGQDAILYFKGGGERVSMHSQSPLHMHGQ